MIINSHFESIILAWILNPETLSDKTSLIYLFTMKVDVKVCGSIIHYVTHKFTKTEPSKCI